MAAPLSPSGSRCLLCSVSSSYSLRRAYLSHVSGDFGGGPQRRILNSKSLSFTLRRRHKWSVQRLAHYESTSLDSQSSFANPATDITSLKLKLLSVASGLNRGLAASEEDLKIVDSAAKELEAAARPVVLTKDLDKLQGKWKLIYSSAFSSRSLGGSRPGPPTGRLIPITLQQVFQRIDILSKDFDNIVELQVGAPWPLPQIEATAILSHKFELIGTANIKITFEKTIVNPSGNLSQLPPFEVPRLPDALRLSSNTGTGEFEVIFLDSDLRITRGDRGELRVFVLT